MMGSDRLCNNIRYLQDMLTLTEAGILLVLCINKSEDLQPPNIQYRWETKTINEYDIKALIFDLLLC